MSSSLDIREVPNGLWITCQPASVRSKFSKGFGAVISGFLALVLSRGERRAQLKAENLEFSTTCNEHTGAPEPWVVDRANIQSMFYDDAHGGGEGGPYYPEGLYADTGRGEACLLPYLTEQQCLQVIEAIYKRFPDMPLIETKSPFDKSITKLGL